MYGISTVILSAKLVFPSGKKQIYLIWQGLLYPKLVLIGIIYITVIEVWIKLLLTILLFWDLCHPIITYLILFVLLNIDTSVRFFPPLLIFVFCEHLKACWE